MVFNITQFFPSLDHWLFSLTLDKARFDLRLFSFFSNYLVGRKTQYLWNNFSSPFFNVDVSIEQDSVLSHVLLALYIFPIFYIFEKRARNIKIPVLLISSINNGLFVSQEKSLEKSNFHLFYCYNIILSVLK